MITITVENKDFFEKIKATSKVEVADDATASQAIRGFLHALQLAGYSEECIEKALYNYAKHKEDPPIV